MPIKFLVLDGISSIRYLELVMPDIDPSSLIPINKEPPKAFAKPQIHFRWSSCQVDLYSIFWDSVIGKVRGSGPVKYGQGGGFALFHRAGFKVRGLRFKVFRFAFFVD